MIDKEARHHEQAGHPEDHKNDVPSFKPEIEHGEYLHETNLTDHKTAGMIKFECERCNAPVTRSEAIAVSATKISAASYAPLPATVLHVQSE